MQTYEELDKENAFLSIAFSALFIFAFFLIILISAYELVTNPNLTEKMLVLIIMAMAGTGSMGVFLYFFMLKNVKRAKRK
jgi:divalent metal cation (Fe/Co/Zn/Cd) transporter